MIATIASFIWLYADIVYKAAVSNRIPLLQTFGAQDSKELVVSMTLSDGSNVKYLIRPPKADKKQDLGGKLAISNETISSTYSRRCANPVRLPRRHGAQKAPGCQGAEK